MRFFGTQLNRLWVGTMAINCQGTPGFLYCYNSPDKWTVERENVIFFF